MDKMEYAHLNSTFNPTRCRLSHTCMSFWGYSNPLLSSLSCPAASTDCPPELPSCKAACNDLRNIFLKKTEEQLIIYW